MAASCLYSLTFRLSNLQELVLGYAAFLAVCQRYWGPEEDGLYETRSLLQLGVIR